MGKIVDIFNSKFAKEANNVELWRIDGDRFVNSQEEKERLKLKASYSVEAWCFTKSKSAAVYKTYVVNRMREVQSSTFGTPIPGNLTISETLFQEEKRKLGVVA
jgi:uncharacterized secreted protein with C-terminal beta-propeller domain